MPTRNGWAMLASAVAAVVVGRVFGLLEMYVLGAGLGTAFAIALVVVNRPLPRLDVRRVARPATVSVGEPARVDIQVLNRSNVRSPRLKLWEPVGDKGGAPMQLAPLGSGEAVSAAYRVPTARRGVLRTGPLRTERTDLLGLCRRSGWLAGSGEVLVVPERVPLAFPGLGSAGRIGEHLRMKSYGQTGTEFHSQREYTPGDDLRRINWKTTARAGTLIVRETAQEGVRRCVVVLDTRADSYDEDGFERAVTAAASVVAAGAAAGVTTRMVAPGMDLRGPDVAPQSLRWLATVGTGAEVVDHTAAGRTSTDGLGLLIVVTSHASSLAASSAVAVAAPDETVIVVSTMSPSAGGKGFHVDGTSLNRLHDTWNRLVLGRHGGGA
ncbi:MAG: DUF58 domain-containing protein [Actinomycetota bacterium]|nr:DUF58 domain-containing protein [Actinomycetota bacterium]